MTALDIIEDRVTVETLRSIIEERNREIARLNATLDQVESSVQRIDESIDRITIFARQQKYDLETVANERNILLSIVKQQEKTIRNQNKAVYDALEGLQVVVDNGWAPENIKNDYRDAVRRVRALLESN